ncbi:MAG: hypothetical protein IJM37_00150, partial [Lachnospiraceae bacterium]|nr:hypothetical protein [Lachnospiraceae bacterium]
QSTGSFATFQTFSSAPVYIGAGNHTIKLEAAGAAGYAINWIELKGNAAPETQPQTEEPQTQPQTEPQTQAPETQAPQTEPETQAEETQPASQYPAWDASAVYVKDDYVSHNGHVYVAKWWTQGNEPGANVANPWDTPWQLVE